ncbi:MAG: hypothetical protein RMJ43_07220 [Chloroherpetonaceae bacterium]|nr:hypothetical protein [Chthonomonadaceae bacterium]MDW8207611.1 hypothetical protein [Chloroherpetonaceae bacterium]
MRDRVREGVLPRLLRQHRFNRAEQDTLRTLAHSARAEDRRRCFDYLSCASDFRRNGALLLELADPLVLGRSHSVRWGVLVLLGSYCEEHPEVLWPLVTRWGSMRSRSLRAAVGVCILEHLLEYHFAEYFVQIQKWLAEGNRRFRLTVCVCGKFGQAEEPENAVALDALKAALRCPGNRRTGKTGRLQ